MTNEELQKLKDAGIDDAVIQSIIAEDAAKQGNAQISAPVAPDLPEIDVTKPSETLKNAQAMGVPTTNEGSYMADAAAIAAGAAPYALPAAGAGLGLYGAAKVGGWGREIGKGIQSMAEAQRASAAAQQATAQGLQQRFNQRMAQQAAQQAAQGVRPGMTPGYGTPTYNVPTGAPPTSGPIAPNAMPANAPVAQAPAQPNILQRGMDTASKMRQLAAQRVLGLGGAVGLGGAAATGVAGGQMAAMTPEQRKAYYDNEMLGAMGGDAALAAAIMNRGQ